MQENQTQKPITLLREDFINNIQDLCNSSGLPFFVISDVMKQLIPQIEDVARRETEKDRIAYKKILEEEKGKKKEDEKS